ncbi:glycosyltransferase family 4 protein, partial [Candidatus Woesearchaeota archaeon]|nr:glycosyltransferase family 4 protein [Candidatus Woesearchaeota archaeon]
TSVHSFMGVAWKYLKPWPLSSLYRVLEARGIFRDRATVMQVPSFFLQALIKEETGEDTVVIQNFFTQAQKQAISTKTKKAIAAMKKGKHTLVVGSLLRVKNFSLVIRAVAQVDATLWIVGTGPEEENLRALAKKEAPKKVRFLGDINAYEVQELMKRVNALAVTSYNESFSIVALEAAAQGACIIGTPVGIVPELIHEDWQIINDVDTLAYAMDRAKRKAPTKLLAYDKEKIIGAFIGLYKRLKCGKVVE